MKESTLRSRLNRRGFNLVSKKDGYNVRNFAIEDANKCIVHGYACGEFTMSLEDVEEWIKDYDANRRI